MVPEMWTDTRRFSNKDLMKAGVIGNPISHSKSPLIHSYCLKKLNVKAIYNAIHLTSESDLAAFMTVLKSNGWCGVNVTLPYKEAVLPYLDSYDKNVRLIGACNTIVNKSGQLIGHNTDAEGFFYPLRKSRIESVIILGNGGASKAVLYQCAKEGIKTIYLVARNHSRSDATKLRVQQAFNIEIIPIRFDEVVKKMIENTDVIVNTTSVGMQPHDNPFEFIQWVNENCIFYDLIYNPWETKMMKLCKNNGATVLNGAPMLAHQAALAFYYFFGKHAETNDMLAQLNGSIKK